MPSAAGNAGKGALEGAGVGAKIGSIVPGIGNVIGGAIGGVVGGIAGLAGTQYSGASAHSLATAIAMREAGIPDVKIGGNLKDMGQIMRTRAAQEAILAPRIAQIEADPTFRATKNLTFDQINASVQPNPATQALYTQGVQQYNAKQAGTSGGGSVAPGLSASTVGGASSGSTPLPGVPPLQTGNVSSSGGSGSSSSDVTGAIGSALGAVPGIGGTNADGTPMSVGDELLGAAGAINSGLAAQKQGSLLNNALNTYNQNYNQGKGIITAAHPVDLSAAFANPSNPFYRPSAGAVPTVGANGQSLTAPIVGTGSASSLPGVPPLQTGGLPTLNVPTSLFGHAAPTPTPSATPGALPTTAAGGGALQSLLAQIAAKKVAAGGAPGIPAFNPQGGGAVPNTSLPINPQGGIPPMNF